MMTLQTFAVVLLAYFFVSTATSLLPLLVGRRRGASLLVLTLSLLGLAGIVAVGSLMNGGENFVVGILRRLSALSRNETAATLLGASAALPLVAFLCSTARGTRGLLPLVLVACGLLGTALFGTLLTGRELLSPYLPHPDTQLDNSPLTRLAPEGFIVEDFADTEIIPVRLAVSPSGRVFVSGHLGIAAQQGGVVELKVGEGGSVTETLVARMLNRPYGLIATDDELIVSRSGQYTRWNGGISEQISTGAVTLLRDFDGDGIMDYYHDVIRDLPGAKAPDYLHQNNGIALGPDGALYVTTANQSDGHPAQDELAGSILRASGQDFEDVAIFASGLRNPFGLAFDASGRLFATDNDAQTGLLGGNLGDKLLEVSEGAFYGHPFAFDSAAGVTKPLLRSKFALGGLTLADSSRLPTPYRDSLFLVVYGEGRIMRVNQSDDGSVRLESFAVVPGAVDIAAAPNGDFYVAVYPDKIVRVAYRGESVS